MNIIKSTQNKVQELEKRLDNALMQDSLRVTEVSRDFESVLLGSDPERFLVLTVNGGESSLNMVLQGEIKFRVHEATNIRVTLEFDGYVVYSEVRTVVPGLYSWSLIKTLFVAPNTTQELVMSISLSGGGSASFLRYNYFLWGYGESLVLGEKTTEPKLYATAESDRYAIFFILNDRCYVQYVWDFPENLSVDEFSFFGEVQCVAPVQLPVYEVSPLIDYGGEGDATTPEETPEEETRTPPQMYNFVVDKAGNLYVLEGEVLEFSSDGLDVVDTGVGAVTSTFSESGEIVVVYSKGTEVYTFSLDSAGRSEPVLIKSFNEPVEEVALLQKCIETTFLAVSLSGGKNYLIVSATEMPDTPKHSFVTLSSYVEFS